MGLTVRDIATALGAEALGNAELPVRRPAEPALAAEDDLALAMTPKWSEPLGLSRARAALVWPGADWRALGLEAAIEVPRARLAMAQLTQAFDAPRAVTGIHPTALIDDSATIGRDVSIGPFSVIGPGAEIGAGTWIDAHVTVAEAVKVGRTCQIFAGVRLGRAVQIGDRCILQPNVVIGADGFSFVTAGPSNEERAFQGMGRAPLDPPDDAVRHRIHSLGSVVVGDDVEVGANSTIDAGTISATTVGRGTKIDNLVQVGHNVVLGEDCVLCAQAAVAGSARIGDRVVLGGKSGVKDNITVGADVVVGGAAVVLSTVEAGQFMMGYPAQPMPSYRAQLKATRQAVLRQKGVSKPGQND
ncbi:UDP-3-O-(3-hydroxymyristoyl)glucosamine N-acyltransferase [Yoonia sp. R2331]|uniref:UDP-3-O-(3-hydroxymyristoyl)glucosamine N-acyltransferase n=1 Tax=Yoonia sp. R2331 TaxID=3237238 RepID=UPI0034E4CF20